MNNWIKIFLFLTFPVFLISCGSKKYSIKENYIRGVSKIDGFTIAELSDDKYSSENLRVCLERNSEKTELKRKLYFNKLNTGYYWKYCTLDLRFVENDTLKNLTLKEKLDILKKENPDISDPKKYDTLPLEFKPGKWYHFFGLDDIDGSFFVYVERDKSFKVEYFEGGPF